VLGAAMDDTPKTFISSLNNTCWHDYEVGSIACVC